MESEADGSSVRSAAVTQQVSADVTADTADNANTALLSQRGGQTGPTAAGPDSDSPDGGAAAEAKPLLPL